MIQNKILVSAASFILFTAALSHAEDKALIASKDYAPIKIRVVKRVPIPKLYHEGLFYDGKYIWVANGEGGKTWVVDASSGEVRGEIAPVSNFTEGITKGPGDIYFVSEWYDQKIYQVRIEDGKMAAQAEVSVAPANPAGVVWIDGRLFAILWTRGAGTKFDLIELDEKLNIIDRIAIKKIQEPAHMAWDGRYLWITSWYSKLVYKVDIGKREILGAFTSPVSMATGIAWDGKYLWVTGTYGDLYQVEIKGGADMAIKLESSAFKEGEMMPKRYAGDGENMSPPLSWSGVPKGAKSIAILCDDPDAPRGDWVHWIFFNIPSETVSLAEGVPQKKNLPDGSMQSINDSHSTGYDGPYPPSGTHRYFFKIFALDKMLSPKEGAIKKDLLTAMKGHILAQGQIIGRYKR